MKFIIELSANETQKAIEQGIILDLITKASEKIKSDTVAESTKQPVSQPAQAQPQATPTTPVASQPVTPAQVEPVMPTAPVQAQPQATPTMPVASQPVAPVPTTTATFTVEQLAVAAMQLKDQNRIGELQNLLAQFGVIAITQLPQEQLPAFAQSLQALGVKL